MKKTSCFLLFCAVFALFTAQCTPKIQTAASVSKTKDGSTLYIKNCGVCHILYNTKAFTSSEWAHHVARMAPKAELNAEETKLVLDFVQQNAK